MCVLTVSCTSSDTHETLDTSTLPNVDIRITSEIKTSEVIIDASFLPNIQYNWLGRVLLLSQTGELWSVTSNGEAPIRISDGPFSDILGVYRTQADASDQWTPGLILALNTDGQVSAFLETDDQGAVKTLITSYSDNLSDLISANYPVLSAKTKSGQDRQYVINLETDQALSLEMNENADMSQNARPECAKSSLEATSYDNEIIIEDFSNGNSKSVIALTPGLTIDGTDAPLFAKSTPCPMGSVFDGGLLVTGDRDNKRITLTSLEFVATQLGKKSESPQ